MRALDFQTLYTLKKDDIPGTSVAIVKDDTMYLGAAFGDRVTRAKLK